jgi:hypothetical protein
MTPIIEIYNKTEIKKGLEQTFLAVEKSILSTENKLFLQRTDGKWSIAENFQHLILSGKPVASALQQPKAFFLVFGFAKKASRSFEKLYEDYKTLLKNGAVATSRFVPDTDLEYYKNDMIGNWKMIAEKFQTRLDLWSEADLDKYRIPHPVLGKLTFREMLFFTIFHTQHHLNRIEELKKLNEKS